jgi:hypothetical protein
MAAASKRRSTREFAAMKTFRSGFLVAAVLVAPLASAQARLPGAIGVLGGSDSDEYQFYPLDRAVARNWVEILAALRGLDFGRFDAGGRSEPGNQGYEYN